MTKVRIAGPSPDSKVAEISTAGILKVQLTDQDGVYSPVSLGDISLGDITVSDVSISTIATGTNHIGTVTVDNATAANLLATVVNATSASLKATVDVATLPTGATDGSGHLQVDILSGAGSGGTAAADDADFAAGTTQGTPAMGVYESTPSSVTDGDLGTVGITATRRLKSSTLLEAGTSNVGDVDVLSLVGDNVDLDTDPGTDNHAGVALLLPAQGGHVVGGTVANPLTVKSPTAANLLATVTVQTIPSTTTVGITTIPSTTTVGITTIPSTTTVGITTIPSTTSVIVVNATAASLQATVTGTITANIPSTSTVGVTTIPSTTTVGVTSIPSTTTVGITTIPATTSVIIVNATAASVKATALIATPDGHSAMDDTNDAVRVNIIAGAGSGGTASADDADFSAGNTNGTPAMGVYESSPSSVTDGDMGIVGITQTRQLKTSAAITSIPSTTSVIVVNATAANLQATVSGTVTASIPSTSTVGITTIPSTTTVGISTFPATSSIIVVNATAASLLATVSGTVTANIPTTSTVGITTIPSTTTVGITTIPSTTTVGITTIPSTTTVGISTFPSTSSIIVVNATAASLQATVAGTVTANIPSTSTVGISTFPSTSSIIVVNSTASSVKVEAVGPAAHDAAVSGNPILLGAEARSSSETAVANGDMIRLHADLTGKLVTLPYALPENTLVGTTANITGTAAVQVIASQSAGVRIFVNHLTITNSSAVGTWVNINDGTTPMYTAYVASGGGGVAATFPTPIRGTAATWLTISCETTASNVRASVVGFKGV